MSLNRNDPTLLDRVPDLPDELSDLMGLSVACLCGRTHQVTMKQVEVHAGAIEALPAFVRDVGAGRRVWLVADRRTDQIVGDRAAERLRAAGYTVRTCQLLDGTGGRPHADEENLSLVERALGDADVALAVGSGTINDLTKLASYRRKIPYLVVATAPSMNGYTSPIAAIRLKGVKRTVECHQPHAVVADLDILRAAPAEMLAAGLGDLESKPTATADYRLAGRLRGEHYCPAPEGVVLHAEARVADAAQDIAAGDPEALRLLTEGLLLSGLSMQLAGSSSPASGGEHLISHYWDMTAADDGRVEGLHGAQVGVATIVAAALYERLAELTAGDIDVEAIVAARPDEAARRAQIATHHGRLAAEVEREALQKRLSDKQLRAELSLLKTSWDALWANLGHVLRPAGTIRSILQAGGASTTAAALGLGPAQLKRSFLLAREIRGRFTVLDLAADLGVLDTVADEVLRRSGCLG